jgi:hypothetical protein
MDTEKEEVATLVIAKEMHEDALTQLVADNAGVSFETARKFGF